jgi:hypothetical protein
VDGGIDDDDDDGWAGDKRFNAAMVLAAVKAADVAMS